MAADEEIKLIDWPMDQSVGLTWLLIDRGRHGARGVMSTCRKAAAYVYVLFG